MSTRREFITLLGGAAVAWPIAARAQAMPVIGFMNSRSPEDAPHVLAAFRQGLSDIGLVEGQNVTIEFRWAGGQIAQLPSLAADLVARRVAVLAAFGGEAAALAAKQATSTIPIVMCLVTNPVDSGLVASLARPGGNVTGVGLLGLELVVKRLELVADLYPQARVLGLLVNPRNPISQDQIKAAQDAANIKNLQLYVLNAATEPEIDAAFATLSRTHADALVVGADGFLYNQREQFAALAVRHAIPAVYELREHVHAGGLLSYGSSVTDTYRQAAGYVGRILKGAKPADLPIAQPTKFELVLNLKTAKALGLTVPHSLLQRADEVIE
jgi:putative tryptophan/tyrosine transport system substrate-binding protein